MGHRLRTSRIVPDRLLAIFEVSTEERDDAMTYVLKVDKAYKTTERLLYSDEPPPGLSSLVDDLYWSRRHAVNKTLEKCRAANFKHTDAHLRQWMGKIAKAVDNTWHANEDVFGYLKDSLRQNPNKRLSDFRAHFLAANAPSLNLTGSNVLKLPQSDFDLPMRDIFQGGSSHNVQNLQQKNNAV